MTVVFDKTRQPLPSPLKAVRRHCLDCCGGSANEVSLCAAKSCPLWPFRFGSNPDKAALADDHTPVLPDERPATRSQLVESGATALQSIKRWCIDCSGGSVGDAKSCRLNSCVLHRFRLGRNPNRAGMGPAKGPRTRVPAEIPRLTGQSDEADDVLGHEIIAAMANAKPAVSGDVKHGT